MPPAVEAFLIFPLLIKITFHLFEDRIVLMGLCKKKINYAFLKLNWRSANIIIFRILYKLRSILIAYYFAYATDTIETDDTKTKWITPDFGPAYWSIPIYKSIGFSPTPVYIFNYFIFCNLCHQNLLLKLNDEFFTVNVFYCEVIKNNNFNSAFAIIRNNKMAT